MFDDGALLCVLGVHMDDEDAMLSVTDDGELAFGLGLWDVFRTCVFVCTRGWTHFT